MPKPHFKLKTTAGTVTLKAEDLTAHIAVARRFLGAGGFGGYLPNPDPVLKKLGKDIAVYRELLSDPIVAGHVRRRKAAVAGMEWRLDDDGVPPKVSETVSALFQDLDLYKLIGQILDAALFGYQPLEVVWRQGSLWLPCEVVAKPQEWFRFDDEGRLHFSDRIQIGGLNNEPVPDFKFLCPTHNASYRNPYGLGDLSTVYWPTVFKRGGLKFWTEFAEKFGSPWIIAKEPRSNTTADTERLLDALEELISNAVASIPNDSSVEIKEAVGKTGSADVYDRLIRYCLSEIAIALLGQNQTTEKDTNHASATAGLEVTRDIRDNDCRIVEGCLNQLIDWVCSFNFAADTARPRFVLYETAEGGKEQAERDQILAACGVRLSENYWKRTYNLSDEDIDAVSVPVSGSPTGQKQRYRHISATTDFAEPAPRLPQDLSDKLAALMPGADALNRQTDAMWQAVAKHIDGVADEDALLEALAAAYPEMDTDQLQDALTNMLFVSSVLGRLQTESELANG